MALVRGNLPWRAILLAGIAAVALGVLAGRFPLEAAGLAALGIVLVFAFAAPAAHLTLLVGMTAIVPYDTLNALSIGGGSGHPGLLATDVLLLAGLARAVPALLARPAGRSGRRLAWAVAAFLAIAAAELALGVRAGHDLSASGAEFRVLLGFGAAIVALPVLEDPRLRSRALAGLAAVGLLLGLWGIAQWLFDLQFGGDVGVRAGVGGTANGMGQVQGGLFGFPVAIVLAGAVLASGVLRRGRDRLLLVGIVGLNAISLLLTFERTFWIAPLVGLALVAWRAGSARRARLLLAGLLTLLVGLGVTASAAPSVLATARQRLLSLGQYASDNSVRYRVVESQHVLAQIRQHPLIGSGLGAEIHWGRPWERVPPASYTYSHDGYLWLAWKLGVPAALLLWAIIGLAIAAPRRTRGPPLAAPLRHGSQGALLALAVVSVTFPIFNTLSITAVMGVLLALIVSRPPGDRPAPSPAG